jgi:hypothetical protein
MYRARTVTSTERVQVGKLNADKKMWEINGYFLKIVQMPAELSEVSPEQLRMLSLSPQTEASREASFCTFRIHKKIHRIKKLI